jgi:glycosyltransferase involved in cell wall biosynthesis
VKIDLVCGSYPPDVCGVADYTRLLARRLRDRGADARIVTTVGRDIACDAHVPAEALALNWSVRGAMQLARRLRERASDVVHIQFPAKPYHGHMGVHILPLLLRSAAPRVVTTLHEYCMAPTGGRLKQLLNVRFSDCVIVTTDHDRDLIARRCRKKQIHVIPIGSNIEPAGSEEEGLAILEALGVPGGARVLVYFGFVRPGKGLEAAFRALAHAPDDTVLAIVSADPDPAYKEKLMALSRDAGVESRIFWTGYLIEREVSSVMRAASAALLPYDDGATFRRGTLLAALGHGLPVVTTRSAATPPALRHKENVLMADPGDSGALGALLHDLLSSPDYARSISERARVLGEQFSWDAIALKTLEVYSGLKVQDGRC